MKFMSKLSKGILSSQEISKTEGLKNLFKHFYLSIQMLEIMGNIQD
jgi:hypothetical protein